MRAFSALRRAVVRAATVTAVATALPFAAAADDLSGGVVPEGIVLVGTSLTLAPYSFINEKGESVGFELDILKAVGERLGITFNFVRVPFSQNFTALQAGVFRMSAASAFMTCERLANPGGVGVFTVPTYSAGQAISTGPDLADKVSGFDDLAGKKVGIESVGSTADKVVTAAIENGADIEKVVFSDNPSLFLGLEQGRVDAAVQSEFIAAWQTKGNPNVAIAHRIRETYFPVGYLFREGDPLYPEFNRVLDELKDEGVLADIYRTWFGTDPDPSSPTVNVVPVPTLESQNCPS
ncbi:substrate-binding periplasmic protein [Acuticoccus sediminis]|uniref:substrate-binding periplasmic protein n=1 Tax=Acuticoccus sediminis TaxID=2184697 RepID=UPI001CFEAF67|nr:transporter substrate-binding domain-containing protein [Acuticoccus sediminis]